MDYGEHDLTDPQPDDIGDWACRQDACSDYRAGFEIRTYRLCKRIMMFHHFPELNSQFPTLGNRPCLIRSINLAYDTGTAFTFLRSITQQSFVRKTAETYIGRSLPPVEFTYEPLGWNTDVQTLSQESIENLPVGIDDRSYQWIDLYSEGISGILTEQATGRFYKRNLGKGIFEGVKLVSPKPSLTGLQVGAVHFQDVEANGQKQLVSDDLDGFYEITPEEEWLPFKNFKEVLNIDLRDPNVRLVDLNGDGKADILISEDNIFVWHASKGKEGFESYRPAGKKFDEERGPNIVFADSTQSIVLADMSGDGLTDIVRIRNGSIAYWPNLGYGRFGAKVNMSNAPYFDHPDHFNPQYIKLADLDGSGTSGIVYLGKDSFKIYFNQSGNSWSDENIVQGVNPIPFPKIDEQVTVNVIDLLGNGTGCIVWSSPMPLHAGDPLRYIDLMGGKKPYIMIAYKNNMGKEVSIEYKPSTSYYLDDKKAGKPWITRLPFPVQCVSRTIVKDTWRQTEFSQQYFYHHGYYDYADREFRGFGRVDQVDAETFGAFAAGNTDIPYITDDKLLYQPPVMTKTWFHTGAFLNKEKILSQFDHEYFIPVSTSFSENELPEPDLNTLVLTTAEYKEALRSCKGMMLRQEVYELDVDELENENYKPVTLFTTAFHNCTIQLLQPREDNLHAVFLTTESEAITYNYELDLSLPDMLPDPRIVHTLNIETDELGNVLQTISIVYPRIGKHEDITLPEGAAILIEKVQQERYLTYTVNKFTGDVITDIDYRLRLLCEVQNYALTGLLPSAEFYFSLEELRTIIAAGINEIPYHILPDNSSLQKRLVECMRILYFKPDLKTPEDFGYMNALALLYETYQLALTDTLLDTVFTPGMLSPKVRADLADPRVSGYLSGYLLASSFSQENTSGQYWIRSGIAGYEDDAAAHFYLPEKYTDPFGHVTTLQFDPYDFYIQKSTDPVNNETEVVRFDYRVLAPLELKDLNGNFSEVVFDILGVPAAMATKGKGNEGDNLNNIVTEIDSDLLIVFFIEASYDASMASKMASYIRREQDWTLQANLAAKEIIQLDKQITSTDIKIQVAEKELSNHRQQIANAKEAEQFLKDKFTKQELYQWIKEQIFSVYKKSYNMAYDMAKKVEKCYRYETGNETTSFIQYGYWDNMMQGLCAGEKLQLALRQMEKSYLEENRRELELTKSVSMALLDPLALQELRTTGKCYLTVPEEVYDLDLQGHYFRRIKTVSLSLPCIAGLYTTVNCTLRLLKNTVRINTSITESYGHNHEQGVLIDDNRFRESNVPVKAIATSTGQRDTGMFELNFRDERYLPFEGAGAISQWKIELTEDALLRQFDYSTIADAILHISYTAREDAGLFKDNAVAYL